MAKANFQEVKPRKKCSETSCQGPLSNESVSLGNPESNTPAFPCLWCGLLHWEGGEPVTRGKQYAFLENGDFELENRVA